MAEEKNYSIREVPTIHALDRENAGFFLEMAVENYTDQPLAIMRANGEIYVIAPLVPNTRFPKDVKVKMIIATGENCTRVPTYTAPAIATEMPYIMKEFTLRYSDLKKGPIVVPEVNCTFGMASDVTVMQDKNILNMEYFNRQFKELTEEWKKNPHKLFPLCVKCNAPGAPALDKLYIDINGVTLEVGVTHNQSLSDGVEVGIHTIHGWKTYYILDIDWTKLLVQKYFITEDFQWVMGTDADAIAKYRSDLKAAERLKLTDSEVSRLIHKKLGPLEDEIADYKAQIEILKRHLDTERAQTKLLQTELNQYRDFRNTSLEQQMLTTKLANIQAEQELLRDKREYSRETLRTEERQRSAKAEADLRVAEAKVTKEAYSVAGAEVANMGTAMKTVAVALPIVAGVVLWASKSSASSIVAGSVLGSVAPAAATAAAGVAAVGLVGGACYAAGKVAASVVKNTYNTMSNAIDSFCSWVSSWW